MSVLGTTTFVIVTRKKAGKTAKTTRIAKTGGATEASKDGKDSENPRINLLQVPCIWYLITFWKKFILALLDSCSEFNDPIFA